MKRKTFEVRLNGTLVATAYAWGSAQLHMRDIVRAAAEVGPRWFRLDHIQTVKDEFGRHTSGEFHWAPEKGGDVLKFEISLVTA